jgi:hypothetical protein
VKNRFLIAVGLAALLTACGGGGGTLSPTPLPTNPATQYSSKLVFTGALAGRQIQSDLRQAESAMPMSAATPIPIMIFSPLTASGNLGSAVYPGGSGEGGYLEAVVSPQPTAAPTTTFTQTNTNAKISPTPTPNPAQTPAPLPTGVIGEVFVSSNGTPNVQSAGSASAAIGSPVNQTPAAQVYVYEAISLECAQPLNAGSAPAWKWNGSGWVTVSAPSQADIYLTGPKCTVPGFASNETYPTLHYPGGGSHFSTDTPFSNFNTSQWQNAETSYDLHSLVTSNPDGSNNGELLIKTADGAHTIKMFPAGVSSYPGEYDAAVEVSGASIDGF